MGFQLTVIESLTVNRLLEGLTDKSDDAWTEGKLSWVLDFWKFHPAILMGIFTMNLTDGWMDRTDDGRTDGWMDFQVESC